MISASSPGGAVAINVDQTLSFTPGLNFSGATTISYAISDGQGGLASATVFVSVTAVNDAPVAVDDGSAGSPLVTVAEDTAAAAIAVLANDSDVDGDALSVAAASSPNGTVTVNVDQTLSFTPALNFNGTTTISYTVSDGQGGSASATAFVSVTSVDDAPVANPQLVTVAEDGTALVVLTGIDVDGDPLLFATALQPIHGTLSLAGAVATYRPNSGFHGQDSFTFFAYTFNGGQPVFSAVATVSITVTQREDYEVWAEQFQLSTGPDGDPDGDSISNAVEYVIGGDPVDSPDSALVPTAELVSANLDGNPGNEDYMVFTYRRTDLAKDDPSATIKVEWSANLAGPWSGTGGMVAQITDGVGVDLVKVYIPRSLAVAGKLFVRLGVTISTPPSNE